MTEQEPTITGRTLAQFREEHGIVSTVLAGIILAICAAGLVACSAALVVVALPVMACATVTSRQTTLAARKLAEAAFELARARRRRRRLRRDLFRKPTVFRGGVDDEL